jgi:hypothetical protein
MNIYTSRRGVMADKKTSAKVASKAAKLLSSGSTSKAVKSVAGSALSQKESNGKGKK